MVAVFDNQSYIDSFKDQQFLEGEELAKTAKENSNAFSNLKSWADEEIWK